MAALIHPIIFYLYGQVAKIFIDYQNFKQTPLVTNLTETSVANNESFKILDQNDYDFDARMNYILNRYIIISFLGLLTNYLANVCLNTTAEKQIKKIRQSYFESIIRQDMSFFDKEQNSPGELNSILIRYIIINFNFLTYIFFSKIFNKK